MCPKVRKQVSQCNAVAILAFTIHFLSGPTRGIKIFHHSILISSPINATHSLFFLWTIMLLCTLMPSITERQLITQPPLLKAYHRTPSQLKESRYVQLKTWMMIRADRLRSHFAQSASALAVRCSLEVKSRAWRKLLRKNHSTHGALAWGGCSS